MPVLKVRKAIQEMSFQAAISLICVSRVFKMKYLKWRFAETAAAAGEELRRFFLKTGIDTLEIDTAKPYIDGVRALFKRRARKR